jgi:hypothetical protein
LVAGGIRRVQERLNYQMEMCRFPPARQTAVNQCLQQLVREQRGALLDLMAGNILPTTQQDWLAACGLSDTLFDELLNRLQAGERPFEDWMHAHGHSDQDIAAVYRQIDEWLIRHGILCPPASNSRLH